MKKKRASSKSFENARFMKPTVSSEFKTRTHQENLPPQLQRNIKPGKSKYIVEKHLKTGNKIEKINVPVLTQLLNLNENNEQTPECSSRTLTPASQGLNNHNDDLKLPYAQIILKQKFDLETDTDSGTGTVITETQSYTTSQTSEYNETGIKSKKIQAAQETCTQLREQIMALKEQQKEFMRKTQPDYASTNTSDRNDTFGCVKSNETSYRSVPHYKPISAMIKQHPTINETNQNEYYSDSTCEFNNKPSQDNLNAVELSESNTSLNTSVKSDCLRFTRHDSGLQKPNKIIKKLYNEKVKYKKKVHELQNALIKLKKDSTYHKTPDIAGHHITYFNADLIGEGRMTLVYSGTCYEDKKAAIKKIVRPDMFSASDRSYLVAEAGLLMTLHHQNVVEVLGVSSSSLQPLLLMELVSGTTLQDKIHSSSQLSSEINIFFRFFV